MTDNQVKLCAALHAAFHGNPAARVALVSAKLIPPALLARFLAGASALSGGQEADVRLWLRKHFPQAAALMDLCLACKATPDQELEPGEPPCGGCGRGVVEVSLDEPPCDECHSEERKGAGGKTQMVVHAEDCPVRARY